MLLHAQQGFRGKVWDLATGRQVRKVLWLDTDRGELEAYQLDEAGQLVPDGQGNWLTFRAKGRFRFEPAPAPKAEARLVMGAPACARCQRPITLRGDDLCAFCRARERSSDSLRQRQFSGIRLTSPLLDRPCEHKGCGRLAEWQVGDEVEGTPAPGTPSHPGLGRYRLFDRAVLVEQHWYCSFHYQPPRLLDPRGEVIHDLDVGAVRPA